MSASHQDGAQKPAGHDTKPTEAVKQPKKAQRSCQFTPWFERRVSIRTHVLSTKENENTNGQKKKRINTFTPWMKRQRKREEGKEGERDVRDQRDQTRRSARGKASQVKKFENKRSAKNENNTHTHKSVTPNRKHRIGEEEEQRRRKTHTVRDRSIHRKTAKDQTCCDTASRVAERTQKMPSKALS